MHVIVASDFEPGSHRAHAINVAKTAGGFARLGHDVTVLCRAPTGDRPLAALVAPYGEPALAWRTVPVEADAANGARRERAFAQAVLPHLAAADVVYARHFRAGLAAALRGVPTAIETHAYVGDPNPALQAAIDATRGPLASLVTISRVLAEHYAERGGDPARIAVVPDGVDVARCRPPAGGTPGPAPFVRTAPTGHALYAGHLYDHKGIPTVLAAARRTPDVGFELLGGAPEDVARTRAAAASLANVRVHGAVPHGDVPRWLWHADALLLPPSAREPSAAWTSPVKLGEYLASERPIVASAIPGLMAWVDDAVVTWFRPDDEADLARALRTALAEPQARAAMRVAAARRLVQRFDYRQRAARILASIAAGSCIATTAGDGLAGD